MNPLQLDGANVILDQQIVAHRNLWSMVMMHALFDLSGNAMVDRLELDAERQGNQAVHDQFLRGKLRRRIQAETREWIKSDYDGPSSFVWICGVLGLDSDAVRERLLTGNFTPLTINHLARIRYEERRAARV